MTVNANVLLDLVVMIANNHVSAVEGRSVFFYMSCIYLLLVYMSQYVVAWTKVETDTHERTAQSVIALMDGRVLIATVRITYLLFQHDEITSIA